MPPPRKIVLYFPQLADEREGMPSSKDLLPLSILTIASEPDADGYEVVILDANLYSQEEAHRRALEACEGALLFGTTGVLGFQVADGLDCSTRVRARFPDLPMVIGGWFASAAPELQLGTGLYDALVVGQGEITFGELVRAVDAGEPLESVPGLALLRDGEVVRTPPRPVVGWDRLRGVPWHLLDIEPYRAHQLRRRGGREVERMPTPPGFQGRPFFGISYYSSFGCPEPCTFCCAPGISNRRWKEMPADRLLDDLCGLQERWGFDAVRFYDANWGVSERRTREFAEGLIDRGRRLWWYCLMQSSSILRYEPSTLDAMRDSGMYVVGIGGETGSEETMLRIGKHTDSEDNLRAAVEMDRRGVCSWVTYIIGYPGEPADSMMATIDQCRRISAAARLARATMWPYRPIPGTALYAEALKLGYRPPRTLREWGTIGEFHLDETWPGKIPAEVARARKLYEHFSTLSMGLARGRLGWWEKRARRRMATGDFRGGLLEARAFDLYYRVSSRLFPGRGRREIEPGHRTSVQSERAG